MGNMGKNWNENDYYKYEFIFSPDQYFFYFVVSWFSETVMYTSL